MTDIGNCDWLGAMCYATCDNPASHIGRHGRRYCEDHKTGAGDCFYVSGCLCCDPRARIENSRAKWQEEITR